MAYSRWSSKTIHYKKFFVDKKLRLTNLEFLKDLEGKNYEELDRVFKRTIDDTNFKNIVGISSKRMLDRELALRFIAFRLTNYKDFTTHHMGSFLDESMEKLDLIEDKEELENIKKNLIEALVFSEIILGKNHRFSRAIANDKLTKTLNRSLFDVLLVCFSEIKDKKRFINKKDIFLEQLKSLLLDEKGIFVKAITEGTSGKTAIENRFRIMNDLINRVLNEKD